MHVSKMNKHRASYFLGPYSQSIEKNLLLNYFLHTYTYSKYIIVHIVYNITNNVYHMCLVCDYHLIATTGNHNHVTKHFTFTLLPNFCKKKKSKNADCNLF